MATSNGEKTTSQEKVALIIANENYTDPSNHLTKSRRNGSDMKKALKDIGFHVIDHENLDDSTMKTEIRKFTNQYSKSKILLLYVSGHVCQTDDKNYLVPCNDKYIQEQADLEENANNLERIIDRFNRELMKIKESSSSTKGEESRLPIVLILLDYSKQYSIKGKDASDKKPQIPGLAKLEKKENFFVQFACDADKVPIDATTNDTNSLYTKHLLKHIRAGNLNVSKVLDLVREGVTKESNGRQQPYSMDGLAKNQSYFLNEKRRPMTPRQPDGPTNSNDDSLTERSAPYPTPDHFIEPLEPDWVPVSATWSSEAITIVNEHRLGSAKDRLRNPLGICLIDRHVLVADTLNHRVLMYPDKRNANIDKIIAGNGQSGYSLNQLSGPTDLIYHAKSKSIIICDRRNRRIVQIPNTNKRKPKILLTGIACWGLAVDKNNNIYVSDTDQHQVIRFRLGSRRLEVAAGGNGQGSRLHQLNHPTYLAIGLAGDLYISDSENNRVVKWNINDTKGTIVAGGKGRGNNLNQLDYPTGLVVDNNDTVYVADYWNHRVMRWFQNSSIGQCIAGDCYRAELSQRGLNCPAGIKLDRSGHLYVADSQNQRIQKFIVDI